MKEYNPEFYFSDEMRDISVGEVSVRAISAMRNAIDTIREENGIYIPYPKVEFGGSDGLDDVTFLLGRRGSNIKKMIDVKKFDLDPRVYWIEGVATVAHDKGVHNRSRREIRITTGNIQTFTKDREISRMLRKTYAMVDGWTPHNLAPLVKDE